MEGKDGKTERATHRRRQEQRKEGNLCVSLEITTAFILFLGFIGLRLGVPHMWASLVTLFRTAPFMPLEGIWSVPLVQRWFTAGVGFMFLMLAPVLAPVLLAAVISSMVQTGPYFSVKPLAWKVSGLNPVKGLKQLVSLESLFKLILSMLKIVLVVCVLYFLLRNRLPILVSFPYLCFAQSFVWTFRTIFLATMVVVLLFVFLAVLDWCQKKYKHERDLMMTRKEVEDERKSQEPSPVVRSMQRRKMRELSFSRMIAEVPKATVVITNPTHVAVALEYDPEKMTAPKVTAKGLRLVAERIKAVAREHGVPIVERPELARTLYKHVKVGREIPGRFFGVVAEVLAYLYRLGKGSVKQRLASIG